MLTAATLGPAGTNHELVTQLYLVQLGVRDYRVQLFDEFDSAVELLHGGKVDCVVQCAAHPDVAKTIGRNRTSVFIVDTFIAPGRDLAILTRRDIAQATSIGLHPATKDYADLSRWQRQVEEQSTVRVAQGLLAGRFHSGIVPLALAEAHPDVLRVDQILAAPQDAWLVYATTSVHKDGVLAWHDSPGANLLRRRSMAHANGAI